MKEMNLTIAGMSCHHCAMAVKKELSKISGIEVKNVGIGSATVAVDPAAVPAEMLTKAVAEAGYTVTSII